MNEGLEIFNTQNDIYINFVLKKLAIDDQEHYINRIKMKTKKSKQNNENMKKTNVYSYNYTTTTKQCHKYSH